MKNINVLLIKLSGLANDIQFNLSLITAEIEKIIFDIKQCKDYQETQNYFDMLQQIQDVLSDILYTNQIQPPDRLHRFIRIFERVDDQKLRLCLYKQIKNDQYIFDYHLISLIYEMDKSVLPKNLERYKKLEITKQELVDTPGFKSFGDSNIILTKEDLIRVLQEFIKGKVNQTKLLEWVNFVWFSDWYNRDPYRDDNDERLLTIMYELEELDEQPDPLSIEKAKEYIRILEQDFTPQ